MSDTERSGTEGETQGMVRCTRCSRYYPPDDIQSWGQKDYLQFAIECVWCFAKRTEKK